ncbi:MAG: type secretion protein [Burkholderiales bacterium]|jgi:type III secretion protein C
MTSWITVTRVLRATVISASILSGSAAQAAAPASWKDTGFSIDANGITLKDVFEEFGKVYGVRISNHLERDALMKARLRANDGIEFLDRLAQPYQFRWFFYSDTLYIVPRNDNTSVRLQVGEDAVQDAKAALIGIGLFEPRFGWGELPDEGIVIVSGPRQYVNLARSILLPEERKAALKGRKVMVFRLKYASATDRVITSRNRSETIPGVKTILSNLLFHQESAEKISDARARLDTDSKKRSRGPKAEKGGAHEVGRSLFGSGGRPAQDDREEEPERPGRSRFSSNESRPRIEADPSLNAIMIYDAASKRELYASLIEELDVEPQQVEIEALIVDIDRNKLSEMGVEWGVRSPGGHVNAGINSTPSDSRGLALPLPGSTLLISNAARFYARLKAMEGTGEARVLATPTVLTLDNVAAVLDLSQTRYLPLVAERYAELADVTAGTMLRVIPRIVRDGSATRVRLEVDIEDGTLGDGSVNASVTRSTISTQAIVDVQHTLVIGGYHAESLSKNKEKVPLLGDIPIIGGLFGNETQSHSSRERLFLITPRLASSTGTAADHQSRVVAQRASTIARASGTLDLGRTVETHGAYAPRATRNVEIHALPAPTEQSATPQPSSPAAVAGEQAPAAVTTAVEKAGEKTVPAVVRAQPDTKPPVAVAPHVPTPRPPYDRSTAEMEQAAPTQPPAKVSARNIDRSPPVATAAGQAGAPAEIPTAPSAAARRDATPVERLQPSYIVAPTVVGTARPTLTGADIVGTTGNGPAQAPSASRITAPSLPELLDRIDRRRIPTAGP